MKTYRYKIELTVEVEAFDEGDAWEAVEEHIGVGGDSDSGITIADCEYRLIK